MIEALLAKFRQFFDELAPAPASVAQRAAVALQGACCGLLLEVARLDAAGTEQKHQAVAQALQAQFGLAQDELAAMIAGAARPENRLVSYYSPVALINKNFEAGRKAQFIEWLWRVAMADGKIDEYEDQLVRKLADLLYVAHNDFILAKHRVLSAAAAMAQ